MASTWISSLSRQDAIQLAETLKSRVQELENKMNERAPCCEQETQTETQVMDSDENKTDICTTRDGPIVFDVEHFVETIVRSLIVNGKANANIKIVTDGSDVPPISCLQLALRHRAWGIASVLIQGGCDTECVDGEGHSLLHRACRDSDFETVQFLVRHGSDVCAVNSRGESCLHIACQSRSPEDSKWETIEAAVESSTRYQLVKFLCGVARFLINLSNTNGDTALHLCVKQEHSTQTHHLTTALVALLLSNGADATASDQKGVMPIQTAMRARCWDTARVICSHPNAPFQISLEQTKSRTYSRSSSVVSTAVEDAPPCQTTLLHQAVADLDILQVQFLLDQFSDTGVALDALDYNGVSALHFACSLSCIDVLTTLIKRGLNPAQPTRDGNFALIEAVCSGSHEVCKVLLEHSPSLPLPINNLLWSHPRCVEIRALQHNSYRSTQPPALFGGIGCLLQLAVWKRHWNVVRVLVQNGQAGIGNINDYDGTTVIHQATATEDIEALMCFLSIDQNLSNAIDVDKQTPLLLGARLGAAKSVATLISSPSCNIEARDKSGSTALVGACEGNHSSVVDLLLKAAADPRATNQHGERCIAIALNACAWECATLLCGIGKVNLCEEIGKGENILHLAARRGRADIAKFVLEFTNGASDIISQQNSQGLSPLRLATQLGSAAVCEQLLQHNCDKDEVSGDRKWNCLHEACAAGHRDVVTMLLKFGVSSHLKDRTGLNPMRVALSHNNAEIAGQVARYDMNHSDTSGSSLLHEVIKDNDVEMVRLLLHHGATIDVLDQSGNSPLHICAGKCSEPEVMKLLLENAEKLERAQGRLIDQQNDEGFTCLHTVITSPDATKLLPVILSFKPNLFLCNRFGDTPLSFSLKQSLDTLSELILEHDPSQLLATNSQSDTLVHKMASCGNIKAIDWLLKRIKEGSNLCNSAQQTPLHVACSTGDMLVIMRLIEHGADVNYPDLLGHTPLFYACNSAELRKVILLLIQHGAKVGLKDHEGNNIMHQAAQTNPEMLRFLMDLEESLAKSQNIRGQTPFHLISSCAPELGIGAVRLLVDRSNDLDVNITDLNGDTILHTLCRSGRIDLAQILVHDAHAALCIANSADKTPLDYVASPEGLVECVTSEPIKMNEDDVKKCMVCKAPFSLKLRKNRCRICGRFVCKNCSQKSSLQRVPEHLMALRKVSSAPVRLCGTCHVVFAEK